MIVKMETKISERPEQKELLQGDSLVDQSVALQSYMQELLNEVSWSEPDAAQEINTQQISNGLQQQGKPDSSISLVESKGSTNTHRQTLAELEQEMVSEDTPLPGETLNTPFEVSPLKPSQQDNIEELASDDESDIINEVTIPAWAGTSFRALYAKHGNLKLVMPLVHVQTVLKAKELVPVEGPLSAFIGYVQLGAQRIPVLDLNSLNNVADKKDADAIACSDKGYVAIAEDHAVGLYFTDIDDTYEVESDVINWCCNDSMVWIAGIDSKNLSIIVDFNRLCDLL